MDEQTMAALTTTAARTESYALRRMDAYRRQRADEAIAYIERCFRERRPIPNLH